MEFKDIKQDKRNYRIHDDRNKDLIRKSIDECGLGRSIVIDNDNEIIGGNGIVSQLPENTPIKVIETKGDELVVVKRVDLSGEDEKRKKLAIMDNSTSDSSKFDFELLSVDFEVPELKDMGIDIPDVKVEEKEVVEDEVPEEVETKCKLGDIWKLGEHRLMCGNSTKVDDVEKLMGGALADLLITDHPYNVNYEGATKDKLKIMNDNMSEDNFREFLRDAFVCADTVMKAGAVFYIWHSDSEGYNFRGACKDAGWQVRQCLIWNKNAMVMGRQDYQWKHEPCLYGWTGGVNVDTGVTGRKLASDFYGIEYPLGGGTIHGKDLSKADCSVNIYCYIKAQETGKEQKAICSIGDEFVNINGELISFEYIVNHAREYVKKLGGFEKLAEWGLR